MRRKNLSLAWMDDRKACDMVLQSLMRDYIKMYKISGEVIKLIEKKNMKDEKLELTAGGKHFVELKIQRGNFRSDTLSPLLFVIAKIPLNHKLRKCTGGYKLTKLHDKINHQMYMDDIKLFVKNEKELERVIQALRIYSQDIGV